MTKPLWPCLARGRELDPPMAAVGMCGRSSPHPARSAARLRQTAFSAIAGESGQVTTPARSTKLDQAAGTTRRTQLIGRTLLTSARSRLPGPQGWRVGFSAWRTSRSSGPSGPGGPTGSWRARSRRRHFSRCASLRTRLMTCCAVRVIDSLDGRWRILASVGGGLSPGRCVRSGLLAQVTGTAGHADRTARG